MTREQGLIVMLGDSLTAGGRWGAAFPALKIRNLGINGDTCAGVWGRLDAVLRPEPAKIFLQIGINDFLRGASIDDVVGGHLRIWEEVADRADDSRLLVISLLPYVEAALPYLPPNLDIMAINSLLAEKAGEWQLPFINLFPRLADEDKQLRLDYTTDGLHLTEAAYTVWTETIRPFVENNE
jgi:lysophospholipase L1-like esterase